MIYFSNEDVHTLFSMIQINSVNLWAVLRITHLASTSMVRDRSLSLLTTYLRSPFHMFKV